jgi:hypothetical protein
MTTYAKTSPYYGTTLWGKFLDVWPGRTILPDTTDAVYQIDPIYNGRPDLLAYDLYKDTGLWWVFFVRNPDALQDPLQDFRSGSIIYVPTLATLKRALGL